MGKEKEHCVYVGDVLLGDGKGGFIVSPTYAKKGTYLIGDKYERTPVDVSQESKDAE